MIVAAARKPSPPCPTVAAPGGAAGEASDEALAEAAAQGSRAAFDAIVDRYADRVYRFVLARVRDGHDAEEVTQEVFLRAWRAIGRYDRRWRLSTWLFTIAHREAVTLIRGRSRAGAVELGERAEDRRHSTSDGSDAGVWSLASRVLGRDEVVALWLRHVEDRSAKEVAFILGRTAVGVRVMLHRARGRLRDAIAREDGGNGGLA